MMKEDLKYDDFGVLIRANSMTRHLEEAFLAENIPYRISGGTSFFQRKEIKDVISYLRVIANTDDDVNILRIINTPRRGIGKSSVEHITDAGSAATVRLGGDERHPLRPGHSLPEKGRVDVDTFMTLIEYFRGEMLGKKACPRRSACSWTTSITGATSSLSMQRTRRRPAGSS
jgi:DNA helicase-2/ATP-dependent DNA helicase PcrA